MDGRSVFYLMILTEQQEIYYIYVYIYYGDRRL